MPGLSEATRTRNGALRTPLSRIAGFESPKTLTSSCWTTWASFRDSA